LPRPHARLHRLHCQQRRLGDRLKAGTTLAFGSRHLSALNRWKY
jgi:hypothetical protein